MSKDGRDGNIPVLFVSGTTLPEGWEKSVLAVWEKGGSYPTEYDKEGEAPSLDATMTLTPWAARSRFSLPSTLTLK